MAVPTVRIFGREGYELSLGFIALMLRAQKRSGHERYQQRAQVGAIPSVACDTASAA